MGAGSSGTQSLAATRTAHTAAHTTAHTTAHTGLQTALDSTLPHFKQVSKGKKDLRHVLGELFGY